MIVACPGCHSRYDVSGRRAGARARCRCGTIVVVPKLATTADALHCPDCGAPCSDNDSTCSYCGVTLFVVACPGCFGRVFSRSAHCQHCGAAMSLPARAEMSVPAHRCPRCGENARGLVAHLLGDTLLDECHECGGVWLDGDAFERMIKSRDQQSAVISHSSLHDQTPPASSSSSARRDAPMYLPCPECGQLMNRKNFANASGVIIDTCRAHGVWFDRDELGRIVQFVMRGGLETARRQELERLEQRLRDQRNRGSGEPFAGPYSPSEPTFVDELIHAWVAAISRFFH